MDKKIPVAVLAATGSVGQRFIQLLDNHPWFEVTALTASDRSAGQLYGDACHWVLPDAMPEWAAKMKVLPTAPESTDAPIVFSALPADTARDAEPLFAQAGKAVFSNASAYRREPDVSILMPEINADQAAIVDIQRKKRGWKGFIVTNSNCTSAGMAVTLKALNDQFKVKRVFAVSLQALSGAGYPGVPSMDIIDNVVPFIGGEEEKLEWESRKMLGRVQGESIQPLDFAVSAHCNRVAVTDGHVVCLSVETESKVSVEEAINCLQSYQAPEVSRDLPFAPKPVIVVRSEKDRPQPRLDRMTGKGMATVVGRVRPDPLFGLKMIVLSHNTIRGAAGGSIYNAELLVNLGKIV
ncbi:MAG: aspartate-semialdehyde dehydrogenase [Anaerolineae bacterium]|nr:aspartate-semialdehyde dehydrogenase [Anaerolineae bacterium]